jgi:hypothetical protein
VHRLRIALFACVLVATPAALLADPPVARPLPPAQGGQPGHPSHPVQPGQPGQPGRPGQPSKPKPGRTAYPNHNGNYNYQPYVYVNGDNYVTPAPHHTPTPHPKNVNKTSNGQQVFSSYSTGN